MENIPETSQPATEVNGAIKMVQIIYFIYFVGLVFPIAHLVGVVLAYINRGDGPEWSETHYRFQIRTFWIFLLYCFIGSLLVTVVIGLLVLIAAYIWLIIRCAKGLKLHSRNEPVPDPATWLW
jgi:uncharacterized membrane protein